MKLGEWNILRVDRIKEVGAYLTDGVGLPDGTADVLLPTRQIPNGTELGDNVRVFLYRDSDDRPIATTIEPLITIGELKKLRVKSVTGIGAFLDWGLSRDLLLPFKEQTLKVEQEKSYLVRLYVDKSGRLAASMKVDKVLRPNEKYNKGDHVTGTIYNIKKDFGAFVAVDNTYFGLIHSNEIFDSVHVGDEVSCRVVKVRDDGRMDLAMREELPKQMEKDAEMVFDIIKSYGGVLPFDDKADASLIKKEFGLSKNAFKRAVGRLLKQGRISISDGNIKAL